MRLLTHNHLICVKKECKRNYPLEIVATKVEQTDSDCDSNFIVHIMANVDYKVLEHAARGLGIKGLPSPADFPEVSSLSTTSHASLIQLLHTVLIDTHVIEGQLVCSSCKRSYLIQQGIPNMRLNEDEV